MLGLCSMNIAKNHWVTFKCTVIVISLHLLVPVTFSFRTILQHLGLHSSSTTVLIHRFYLRWTISKVIFNSDGHPSAQHLQTTLDFISPQKAVTNVRQRAECCHSVPLTFEASKAMTGSQTPTTQPDLCRRTSWEPSYQVAGQLG